MLETLMNLVQQHAGDAIVNNPAIPNNQNQAAMEAVSSGIMGGLQQQAQGGGLGDLLHLVTGGSNVNQSPVTQGVQQNVEQSLMQKLGISPGVAMSVAGALVPMVLSKLMNRAQDPNDTSVDGNSIMNSVTGHSGDWMSAAQSAMSGGQLNMGSLMSALGGGGQQGGGGLGGMLGGLFGR